MIVTFLSTCCDCADIRGWCAEKLWEAGCRGRGGAIVPFVLAACPLCPSWWFQRCFPKPPLQIWQTFKDTRDQMKDVYLGLKSEGLRSKFRQNDIVLEKFSWEKNPWITIWTSILHRWVVVIEEPKRKQQQLNWWFWMRISHCFPS